VTAPRPTWTTISAATTQKYFNVACIEGVGFKASNGSSSGKVRWRLFLTLDDREVPQPALPTPASSTTKLITDQTTSDPVGRLPTSSSAGQLLV
jgi:hypothetical protein